MKEVRVHGGGAVFARISERFGLRLHAEGIFFGIETVRGRAKGGDSVMDMATSSSSSSIVEVVGEEAVEEDVLIDKA